MIQGPKIGAFTDITPTNYDEVSICSSSSILTTEVSSSHRFANGPNGRNVYIRGLLD